MLIWYGWHIGSCTYQWFREMFTANILVRWLGWIVQVVTNMWQGGSYPGSHPGLLKVCLGICNTKSKTIPLSMILELLNSPSEFLQLLFHYNVFSSLHDPIHLVAIVSYDWWQKLILKDESIHLEVKLMCMCDAAGGIKTRHTIPIRVLIGREAMRMKFSVTLIHSDEMSCRRMSDDLLMMRKRNMFNM